MDVMCDGNGECFRQEDEIAALLKALVNIRLCAAGAAVYGHGPTVHTDENIIARKDKSLHRIIEICAHAGVVGSVLRSEQETESATTSDAVDPPAADSGNTTTRDA